MTRQIRTAEEKRRDIRRRALEMGIDETFISQLVERFYHKIRQDSTLGPIFNAEIGDQWESHLARMKDFWSSVALNTGRYHGRPVPQHVKLQQVNEDHFSHWLSLFRQTLEELSSNEDTVDYFMERAERIADSLKLAMFGIPGLRPAHNS